MLNLARTLSRLMLVALLIPAALSASVPTPASILGHTPGDDYYLANYSDSLRYFHALADASDKIKMIQAGTTSQGRRFEYAIISNPDNLARFEHYADISKRLADSRGLSRDEAKALAQDAKIIVHIDGGMHSSEVADHQLPPMLAWHLLSNPDDPEVMAILDNVILVLWPTLNPDGMDMQVEWYRQQVQDWDTSVPVPAEEKDQPLPWLYQEYVGHDNNRDGYMLNLPETRVVIAEEQTYAPAIWYTHHQVAPFPARIWMPPFYDPTSANIHPLMRIWTSNIGINMMSRFEHEGKPGAIAQATFDNWYPGFLDYIQVFRHTTAYFTEVAHSSATPRDYSVEEFPEAWRDFKPMVLYPSPWKGGIWRIRDSVDYMLTASLSTLETAVKYRQTLLFNRWLAGHGTIERFRTQGPFAWVVSAEQADAATAALLMQKMREHGIEVHRTTNAITLDDRTYPEGSWLINMQQPFAGLVQELFERQAYPAQFLGEDGMPPKLPYDATGWTLPLQMGVDAVAISTPLSADVLARLEMASSVQLAGAVHGNGSHFRLDLRSNASYAAVNQALAGGASLARSADGDAFVVSNISAAALETIVHQHGLIATATPDAGTPLRRARVGMYRPWGSDHAAMDAGWTEWVLKEFGFAPTALDNAGFQAGDLASRFDVIVLPDTAPGRDVETAVERLMEGQLKPDKIRAPYAGGLGEDGLAALKAFVAEGGSVIALNNSSTALIELLELPVENILAEVENSEFFCAGALFRIELSKDIPLLAGLPATPVVMFQNGPAFRPASGFTGRILARYGADNPLESGFAVNPSHLKDSAAALELDYGQGKILLYGFSPQWRGQSHGAFKFLFNPLYLRQR